MFRTREGRRQYARQKEIDESMFGLIKQARSFRQFLRRVLDAVPKEWSLVCTAHCLLRLYGAPA